jgi:hypothetical protein
LEALTKISNNEDENDEPEIIHNNSAEINYLKRLHEKIANPPKKAKSKKELAASNPLLGSLIRKAKIKPNKI